ncbi:MAG: hypothetical protein WC564_01230 [Patescibacteria group bacterium]
MKHLTNKEGVSTLPLAWTVFVRPDKNYSADPFSYRTLRYRCFFDKLQGQLSEKLMVYFHLIEGDESNDYLPSSKNVYLYGAFNQVNVYQVRSFGKVREMTEEERVKFIKIIKDRLNGKDVGDELPIKLSGQEKELVLIRLKTGTFYCFEPVSYELGIYHRM